jgi:hypothetical protein
MSNAPWSETIAITCPFEGATHTYTLVYFSKGQGTIVTALNYGVEEPGNEPKVKDVKIVRAFKCSTTGKRFKAETEMSVPPNMDKDNISVK